MLFPLDGGDEVLERRLQMGLIVDEQHKLGVKQRAVLKSKGLSTHYLVMTATPIPRTLALSYFADFDYSEIDELPPGRQPIKTRWLRASQAGIAYDFIRKEVQSGRQAYIVVPQIDDNGLEDAKSVIKEHDRLSKGPLSTLRLGILHGQLKTEEKQQIMTAFRDRQIDVYSGKFLRRDSGARFHHHLEPEGEAIGVELLGEAWSGRAPQVEIPKSG